jgi:6-pyruvoyltetrahydropterin/6-carboxytetrahydropterin synthase
MVLDFGFIKAMMMSHIHDRCDHGLILYNQDPILPLIAGDGINTNWVGAVDKHPKRPWLKLYLLEAPPTAEVLAHHWFQLLQQPVRNASYGLATLDAMRVHETPNSIAIYSRGGE